MRDFSSIDALLIKIIKKNVRFKWGKEQEDAFNMLKSKLISAPILILLKFDKHLRLSMMLLT